MERATMRRRGGCACQLEGLTRALFCSYAAACSTLLEALVDDIGLGGIVMGVDGYQDGSGLRTHTSTRACAVSTDKRLKHFSHTQSFLHAQ